MSTTITALDTESILRSINSLLARDISRDEKLFGICEILDDKVDVFDWTGFYMADPNEDRMLVLGPFVGEATDHTRIPYGTGICGQVAENHETFVVADVSKQINYLACSVDVKSELVVPIMKEDTFVAQLDIDSYTVNAFTEQHVALIEEVCKLLEDEF